jgi:hypothetical protein
MNSLREAKERIAELEESLGEIQEILDGLFDPDSEGEESE